jgi:hypothetical protein
LFAKVAASTSEAAPSVVWSSLATGASGSPVQACVAAFSNLIGTTDVAGAFQELLTTNSSAGGAAITTTADKDLVLSLTMRTDAVFTTFTAPAGFTNVTAAMATTSGADETMGWAYQVKATAGAVSAPAFGVTGGANVASVGVTIALKAASSYAPVILATPGLVSYWRMSEASGNALDSKGTNHGTVAGTFTRQAPGLLTGDSDTAMVSSGAIGNLIDAAGSSSMNVGAKLTLECWLKITALPASGSVYVFYRVGSDYCWWIKLTSTGRYDISVYDINAVGTNIFTSTGVAVVGTRQHLVLVYDAAGTMKLYVNGVSIGTPSRTPNANVQHFASASLKMFCDDPSDPSVNGTMDEAAFYNTALTAQQALDHYNAGLGLAITADTPTGIFPLSGTRTESYSTKRSDAPTGLFKLTGTATDSFLGPTKYTDVPTGIFPLSGSLAAESNAIAGAREWTAMRIHERPPLRHSIAVVTPTLRRYRWGEDEPRPENVFNGLRWGSTMPGGYDSMDCVLPRKPGVTYNDLERLTTIQVINASGSVVGEYRLERTPQTSGDQMSIAPGAVGWQAHLDDNKGVSIIFLDRELGEWNGSARARILYLAANGYNALDASVVPDAVSGVPALDVGFDDPGGWSATYKPIVEPVYDAGPGNLIGRVKANWGIYGATAAGDGNWTFLFLANSSINLDGAGNSIPDIFTGAQGASGSADLVATVARRYAGIQWFYGIAGGTASSNYRYGMNATYLRVIGDHNLPIYGTTPATEGLLASDMIAYALAKWCPLLRTIPGSIVATNFIIPQAKFKDHTTVSEIVKQNTRFGLEDWAVWNNKTFYLNPRNADPMAKKWRARIGPAKLEQTGQQMDRLWESILVQYTDVDGTSRVVGPPGSGVDVEDSRLKDSDPANPANVLGIPRRDKLVMGTSTTSGAIEVGRRFLEEQKLVDRSGRASLVGHVEDDRGVMHAFSDVRAGDAVSFIDAADTSYRRIVRVSHDNASKTASVDLDAPPEGLQAVLERLGVVLAPLGL